MPHSEAKKRQTIGLLTKSLVEVRRSPAWEEMVNLAQENDINLLIYGRRDAEIPDRV